MSSCPGYGIITEDLRLRENAYELLLEDIRNSKWELKKDIQEFLEENKDFNSDAEAFKAFVEKYENTTYLWDGIEGLLVDFINYKEFFDREYFRYEDCCVYVEATLPYDDYERAKLPTVTQIDDIVEKYFPRYFRNVRKAEWLEIYLGD